MATVAAEISSSIKENLTLAKEGDPTKTDKKLSEYLDNTLQKDVQATVIGAQVYKTYWEKRRYMMDKGAKKDFDGFVCTSLIKVPKKQLRQAFSRIKKKLNNAIKNESKAAVATALEKAQNKI